MIAAVPTLAHVGFFDILRTDDWIATMTFGVSFLVQGVKRVLTSAEAGRWSERSTQLTLRTPSKLGNLDGRQLNFTVDHK